MEYAVVSIGLYLDKIILTFPHDYFQLNKLKLNNLKQK